MKVKKAQELHDFLMPLFKALFPPQPESPSPAPVKAMMNVMGLPAGGLRLPMVEVSDEYKDKLKSLLIDYKLIPQIS